MREKVDKRRGRVRNERGEHGGGGRERERDRERQREREREQENMEFDERGEIDER